MSPRLPTSRFRQRGVNLVAALFVLVVLAGLAAFIVTLAGTQHQTSALAAQSARAWLAAQAGVELAAFEATRNGQCDDFSESIQGFDVEVTCNASEHRERGEDFRLYALTAVAEAGSTEAGDRVRREVTTTVSDQE